MPALCGVSQVEVYRSVGRLADSGVEFSSFEDEEVFSGLEDATLGRNRPRRVHVVSGHHANCDAGTLALAYRLRNLTRSYNYQLSLTDTRGGIVL